MSHLNKKILFLCVICAVVMSSCGIKNDNGSYDNSENDNIVYNNYYELDNSLFIFINKLLKNDYLLENNASGKNSNIYEPGHYYEDEYIIGETYETGFRDGIITCSIIDLDNDNNNELIIYKFKRINYSVDEPEKRINYIEIYKNFNGIYNKLCEKELLTIDDVCLYDIKYGYVKDNNKSYFSIYLNKTNTATNDNTYNKLVFYQLKGNSIIESKDDVNSEKICILNHMYNEVNNLINKRFVVYKEHNNTYNNKYNINFVKSNEMSCITEENYKNVVLDLCLTDGHILYEPMDYNFYSSIKYLGVVIDNYNTKRVLDEYDSIKVVDDLCDYDNGIVTVKCTKDKDHYYYVLRYGIYNYQSGESKLCQISIIYKDKVMPLKEQLYDYYGKTYSITELKTRDIKDILFYENSTSVDCMDAVEFGKFEQDNDIYNGKEDIEWVVLDNKDNKALLLSKYVLYASYYGENSSWEDSYVRHWLNNDFINEAFSCDESNILLNIKDDKVFLLDSNEVSKYFKPFDDIGRVTTKPTEYAKNQSYKSTFSDSFQRLYCCNGDGIYDILFKGNTEYWLKDSCVGPIDCSYDGFWNSYVSYNGYLVNDDGMESNDSLLGLRPAIWVDLSKIY